MTTIFVTIQQRRGTAAQWIAANPVLAEGEEGFETDTGYLKIGDGLTHWNDLAYFPQTSTSEWSLPTLTGLSYVGVTQFSVLGNQTSIFPVGIRVKAVCTGGTIYGTVTAAVASGSPTSTLVTVQWDTVTQLDSGLSAVYVGIFSPVNYSVPPTFFLPVGAMFPYGGASAPTGFLLCYGQAVSRTTYAALFAILGTSYGSGDGSYTFNLPDRRGRSSIGVDSMGGSAANIVPDAIGVGVTGGQNELDLAHTHTTGDHTLTINEIPAHTHTFTISGSNTGSLITYLSLGGGGGDLGTYSGISSQVGGSTKHNHGATGSSLSTTQDIMNPWLADNWVIKY